MPRFSEKNYQRHVWMAMVVYIGCMFLLWPQSHVVSSPVLKTVLALLPLVPVIYLIGQMMRRVRDSDELEQRTHLVALGVATMVVSVLSLGAGFLAAARVVKLDGDIVIWVFPVIMVSYGLTRWRVARGYGVELACDEPSRFPVSLRLLLMAALIALGALVFRQRLAGIDFGLLLGMAAGFAVVGAISGVLRWRRRRREAA